MLIKNPFGACFTVARILLGVFSGFATGVCPMYIIELASKKDRGWIGVLNQLMITIGILGKKSFYYYQKKTIHK